jgi:hypothetical protein
MYPSSLRHSPCPIPPGLKSHRDLTETSTTENTCGNICEIDGVLWKNKDGWVDVRPSVDLLDNGRLWIEWEGAGVAYDLEQEEAEELAQKLMNIVKMLKAKKSKGEV